MMNSVGRRVIGRGVPRRGRMVDGLVLAALMGAAGTVGGAGAEGGAVSPELDRLKAELVAQRAENQRMGGLLQGAERARREMQAQLSALESRLAHQGRLNGTLRSQLERLEGHLAETGSKLEAIQDQSQAVTERLAALQRQRAAKDQVVQQLRSEATGLREALEDARQQLAALEQSSREGRVERAALEVARREALGRIEGLEQEVMALEAEAAACQAQLGVARTEMAALEKARDEVLVQVPALREALAGARALLGPEEGGSAELTSAWIRAAAVAKAYMDEFRRQRQHVGDDPAVSGRLEAFSSQLFAAQTLVARLMGAQAVYTVRPQDTLTTLAAYFYDSDSRWHELYDANGYALEDADLLVPGLVLVIP